MSTYTKTYSEMRGVDLSSERSECDPRRFNNLLNMWRDYHSNLGAAVETAPGFRKLEDGEGRINGIHYMPPYHPDSTGGTLLVHCGERMYTYRIEETDSRINLVGGQYFVNLWKDSKSSSVYHYGRLYVLDGAHYRMFYNVVEENGGIDLICEDVLENPYIPTTFLNGNAHEQRNMLSNVFKQENTITGAGNDSEEITIKDPCRYIKTLKINGNERYLFKLVSPEVLYPDCRNYRLLGLELTTKDEGKLFNDPRDVGFGQSQEVKLGRLSFEREDDNGRWIPETVDVKYLEYIEDKKTYGILVDDAKYDGGGYLSLSAKIDTKDGYISSLYWYVYPSEGAKVTVEIYGEADPAKFSTVKGTKDYLTGNPDFSAGTSAIDAILGCTIITEFDQRLFFSGNPSLPNSVFYTHRNEVTGLNDPSYVGVYNYLNDGTGNTPISALMTTPTQLIVLKGHSTQGESVYYHTAQYTSGSDELVNLQPRTYPREDGLPNLGCLGVAANFADDPCFLTKGGLKAVGKSQVNLERSIAHRSSLVDAALLNEDLDKAFAAEWDGYLLLFFPSGRVYLADSRQLYSDQQGIAQYEWFVWDDIGEYVGQTDRYHYLTGANPYLSTTAGGYPIGIKEDRGYVDGDVKEAMLDVEVDENGNPTRASRAKYVVETVETGTYAFLVDTDGEQTGGEFSPATAATVVGDILLFGTESGSIFVFNTDNRDKDGYISQETYHRNNRGYDVFCSTKSDNCGHTNLSKNTVRGSFVLKTKAFPSVSVSVKVRTDRTGWKEVADAVVGRLASGLEDLDFGALSFRESDESFSVIREREKKWVEKQLLLENWCYLKPFGFISATYDFEVAGKVKIR